MNTPNPRSSVMSPRRLWTVFVGAFSLSLLLGCDGTRTGLGGSGDETSTLAFYRPDGKPAVGARISVFGSADTSVEPRKQVVTDADGHARIPSLDKGFYNLVVRGRDGNAIFQDSLFSDGGLLPVASDTLHATGVLTGRLKVQPQHSPRIAWIQVLGAGIWSNVDDSGRFRIEGVPQGRFTLAALTRVDGYTPTFARVKTVSDSTVDGGTIELVYTGLPVVQDLEARFDTLAGLVHLKWDSVALRRTWHYNVYRDDILLGQTSGTRWIDTVSDEYPGNVSRQGVHTYQVRMANADSVGSKWESITMRIISAYLYEEVKIDWEKRSELPWPSGLYRIDTAEGELVCWRSAEYGTIAQSKENTHIGWIQKWMSEDSGRTWKIEADSLDLGALPVRFDGRWWSVLCDRTPGAINASEQYSSSYNVGRKYNQLDIVSSADGMHWSLAGAIELPYSLTTWRLELVPEGIEVVGGCLDAEFCSANGITFGYQDKLRWTLREGLFAPSDNSTEPGISIDAGLRKQYWVDGTWWSVSALGSYQTVGDSLLPIREIQLTGEDLSLRGALMGYHLFREGGLILEFGFRWAVSMDSSMGVLHAINWPAKGAHYEMRYGDGILSASDSGIYLGKIRPGPPSDPRGTWVRKTEISVLY